MTHGAKNGESFSETMGPSISNVPQLTFSFTLTHTLVCIYIVCILTADVTVKPVLSSYLKKKTNYHLMQVKSIEECSKGSILQSFRPSLSYYLLLRSLVCLLSGCLSMLRHVLLY